MALKELVAPCGLYCGWRPYYIVGTKEFKCNGCWRRKEACEIRDCAKSIGLELCTFCVEFPCSKLYEMYSRMKEFFDEIKRDFPRGVS